MRVLPKPLNRYPWFIRLFFWKQRMTYGQVLDPGLLWGRSPLVFAGLALLYGAVNRRRSPLSAELRALITVRVSQINHCEFCTDINSATLHKRGASWDKIAAVHDWPNSPLFDAREQTALEYAEAVTRSELHPDDSLFDHLREHYDEDALVELTGLIAFQNMSSKFNAALEVPPQGFCRMPDAPAQQSARSAG